MHPCIFIRSESVDFTVRRDLYLSVISVFFQDLLQLCPGKMRMTDAVHVRCDYRTAEYPAYLHDIVGIHNQPAARSSGISGIHNCVIRSVLLQSIFNFRTEYRISGKVKNRFPFRTEYKSGYRSGMFRKFIAVSMPYACTENSHIPELHPVRFKLSGICEAKCRSLFRVRSVLKKIGASLGR